MSVRVKICGLKSADMVQAALAGGADYIGLVHFAKSPRHVGLDEAKALADLARAATKVVVLLVDPDDATVRKAAELVDPHLIQLHGSATPERVAAVARLARRPVMKAIKVETAADAAEALAYRDAADLILFDAKAPKGAVLPGGNGVAFDWRALADVTPKLGGRWMLSGGLTPDSVAEAVRLTGAPAVDVSSGVETAPGVKSADLIQRFLLAVKPAKQHR